MERIKSERTAGDAGWKLSRYNLSMQVSEGGYLIANLVTGSCAVYSSLEAYLLSVFERLSEDHPMIKRFSERGLIVNYDELSAIESRSRLAMGITDAVNLTICPTLSCNFNCPYCFENHLQGKMSEKVQDDVVALTRRMLERSRAKKLRVTWFGGEPLLAPEIIESLSKLLISLSEEYGADYKASIVTNGYFLNKENVDMLSRVKVGQAQVTLDGVGSAHDRTRHLTNGGGSFDVITENLRNPLPLSVTVRYNVSADNVEELEELKEYVEKLASDSGNKLTFIPDLVHKSIAADKRGEEVRLLEGDKAAYIEACGKRVSNQGNYCGAQRFWSVCIDEKGRLYKCWESVGMEDMSFGTAGKWDPANSLQTADNHDLLTAFINTAPPSNDDECRACIWFPHCLGGDPNQRLFIKRRCPAYKERPGIFLETLYEKMKTKKKIQYESIL
ncbi:radical SAM additional 4Fe4S-binding domain-containing protein [Lachnospiraceae bacterium JC7]|nr:radical SAM additional 4Fe4S-binding domain-containing protein [Lachnospiraceae bacterium JC7]